MYEVMVSHEAGKYYKKQDKDTKRRINKCIDNLSREPLLGSHLKKLHGELEGKHRYEVGGIRIVEVVKFLVEIFIVAPFFMFLGFCGLCHRGATFSNFNYF